MGAIGNLSDFPLPAWLSPGKETIRPFLISHVGGKTKNHLWPPDDEAGV